jgi:hypothetical protein
LDQLILKIKQLQHDEEEDDSTQPDSLVMAGAPPIPEMKVLRDLYEIFSNPHNDLDCKNKFNCFLLILLYIFNDCNYRGVLC